MEQITAWPLSAGALTVEPYVAPYSRAGRGRVIAFDIRMEATIEKKKPRAAKKEKKKQIPKQAD